MNITEREWGFCPHCHIKYLPLPFSAGILINTMFESHLTTAENRIILQNYNQFLNQERFSPGIIKIRVQFSVSSLWSPRAGTTLPSVSSPSCWRLVHSTAREFWPWEALEALLHSFHLKTFSRNLRSRHCQTHRADLPFISGFQAKKTKKPPPQPVL